VWVSRNDLSGSDRLGAYVTDQFGTEEAFAVVFENDGVDLGKTPPNVLGNARDLLWGRGANLFSIHPHDLLIACDNPRLHDRPETGFLNYIRGIDFLVGQETAELPPVAVRSDEADDRDVVNEFAQIPRDICRTAGIKAVARH